MAGERDDHRCAQPWHQRREATRRDPLQRLEFADWCQSPAQSHLAALVDREQQGGLLEAWNKAWGGMDPDNANNAVSPLLGGS
jgi:hypothetical protein